MCFVLGLVSLVLLVVLALRSAGHRGADGRLDARLGAIEAAGERVERAVREELSRVRQESAHQDSRLRTELADSLGAQAASVRGVVTDLARPDAGAAGRLGTRVEGLTARNEDRIAALSTSNEQRIEQLRVAVETRLDALQRDTAGKLDQMRATVEEKLQSTLERRLGESFRQVSDRLEQVHRGLGRDADARRRASAT